FVYWVDAIIIDLFYVCYKIDKRKKSERVNDDIGLTEALTNLRRNSWSKIWLLMSYGLALINIAAFVSSSSMILFTGGITLIGLILVFASIKIEFDTRKLQEELTKDIDNIVVDEDDYWIWGLFYYNPNDSHLIVNNRIGINTGLNLAKTAGKVIMGLSALILLSIPVMMPAIDYVVNKAPVIEFADDQLLVNSGHYNIKIKENEIVELKLLEECPSMNKMNGTNMPNLNKGFFKVKDYGNANVCIDPTVTPYIYIKIADGHQFFINSRDSEITRNTYNQLK
ncbi:MAG: hypothetical protein MJ150_06350, partial [Clostridia bacterium]|nr:hypothetical protein [Clostridia bacterium]